MTTIVFLALRGEVARRGRDDQNAADLPDGPVLIGFCTRFTVTVAGWLASPGAGGPTFVTVYWKVSVPDALGFGV